MQASPVLVETCASHTRCLSLHPQQPRGRQSRTAADDVARAMAEAPNASVGSSLRFLSRSHLTSGAVGAPIMNAVRPVQRARFWSGTIFPTGDRAKQTPDRTLFSKGRAFVTNEHVTCHSRISRGRFRANSSHARNPSGAPSVVDERLVAAAAGWIEAGKRINNSGL